ncbi:MAG TPA: GGDEF domain-containing protein, partial [Actinoplanes sp.]|nr:GGDEF domain-containing protein [Actinoplanes sp.]
TRPGRSSGRSRRERIRMTLDLMIVSSASAVVAWSLMSRPELGGRDAEAYFVAVFGCGVVLCTAYAGLRAAMTGEAPASLPAATPLIISTFILAAANILLPSGTITTVGTQMALLIAPSFILLAGPRIQVLQGWSGMSGHWRSRWSRHYPVLPYAGTVVCAAVLVILLATRGLGVSSWGALAVLLVNVTLIIARQVLTLAENNGLVDEVRDRERRLNSLLEQLRFQAGHDELTGLANRRQFTAAMAGRHGEVTVLLIDLNGFKQINDTYGHTAGDEMLRHVTGLLLECSGPDDLPARLGGDEFAVLVAGDAAAGELIAARLRTALRRPAVITGREIQPGASIGAATGPADDPDRLLHTADLRMYEDKQRSRAAVS